MRALVFGGQQIGVDCLDFLLRQKEIQVLQVVTKESPWDKVYGYASMAEFCRSKKIPVITPENLSPDLIFQMEKMCPDIIFSFYSRHLFPSRLVNLPRFGCINIHPSLLPFYRGPAPTAWALEQGETHFGITIHKIDEGIDTGDILIQQRYPIGNKETGFQLFTRSMKLGTDLFKKNYHKIINQKIKPRKQNGIGSYFGKKDPICFLDWRKTTDEIERLVRVYAKPYNMVRTTLKDRELWIDRICPIRDKKRKAQGSGKIVKVYHDGRLLVSTVDGFIVLEVYEIKPSLKKKEQLSYLKCGTILGKGKLIRHDC